MSTRLLFALLFLGAWASALSPNDFARGMLIDPEGRAPLQALLLPEDVYRYTLYADLRDLRVFNALGDEVAFAIVPSTDLDEAEPDLVEVPAYSLVREAEEEDPELRALRERVEQVEASESAEGLDLRNLLGLQQTGEGAVSYILDAREVIQEIRGVRLSWDTEADSFLTSIRLELSDDLIIWEPWGETFTVAGLRAGEHALARNEISLPARQANFIRLLRTDSDMAPLPELQRVEVELVPSIDPEERRWWRPERTSAEATTYTFDLGGAPTIDSARFSLPQNNVVARARLQSSAEGGRGYRTHFEGLIYRLQQDEQQDEQLDSLLVSFAPVAERYWRLELLGAPFGEGILELGQVPEVLVFVASGEAPYTLAYGSVFIGETSPRLELGDLPPLQAGQVAIGNASFGSPFTLGGEAALVTPSTLRWRVGIGAALALAIIALAIYQVRRVRAARKAEA